VGSPGALPTPTGASSFSIAAFAGADDGRSVTASDFHGLDQIKDVPGTVHRNVGGIVNPIVNAIVKIPARNPEK